MAHKTFISYKYSEAQNLRDRIISSLGFEYGKYYQGETSYSPDLTDTSTENIKRVLSDMIYDTSVTIVIMSPNMHKSQWMDWEIKYSLKKTTRDNRTSQRNGVVCVIMECMNSYDWFRSYQNDMYRSKVPNVIQYNRNNLRHHDLPAFFYGEMENSYISYVHENIFLMNPQKYIDNAFEKSQHSEDYNICIDDNPHHYYSGLF